MLRYASAFETPAITIPNGLGVGQYVYAINDIHHYLRRTNAGTFGPTQIPMKEEWSAWYNKFRVNKVEVSVTMKNTGAFSAYAAIAASYNIPGVDALSSLTDTSDIMRAAKTDRWWRWAAMMPAGNGNMSQCNLKLSIPIMRMTGYPNYRNDTTYYGTLGATNASPTNIVNLFVFAVSGDGGSLGVNYTLTYNMQTNFYVTVWQKDIEQG